MRKRCSKDDCRGRRGFTFIEILVALFIISTALVAIIHLFSKVVDAEAETRFYTIAPLLAGEQMALVKSGVLSRGDTAGYYEDYPGYDWRVEISDAPAEAINTLGKAVDDLKQVDVTVSNDEDSKSYHLRAYAFLP